MNGKRLSLFAFLFLCAWVLAPPGTVAQEESVTLSLSATTDYHLNNDGRPVPGYDFFVPLYADDGSVLFFNPRYHIDTETNLNRAEEWNLGLGYRRLILDDRAILGANVYYDWRRSEFGNQSEQVGAGLELLTENWEARTNGYLTLSGPAEVTSRREFYFGQNGIYFTDFATYEVPMSGVDGEIGFKVPFVSDYCETWVYGGGYYFTAGLTPDNPGITEDMAGYSGRVEVRPADYLKASFTVRDDNVRGTDYYGQVQVEVPFSIENLVAGKNPFEGLKEKIVEKRYEEVALAGRMHDPVVRDPDIITAYDPVADKAKNNGIFMLMKYVDNTYGGGGSDGTWSKPYTTIAAALTALVPTSQVIFVLDKGTAYDGFTASKTSTTIWGQGYDIPGVGLPHGLSADYPEVTGPVSVTGSKVEIMGLYFNNPAGTGMEVTGTLANIHHNQFNNRIGVDIKGAVGNMKIQYNEFTSTGSSGAVYGIYSNTPGKNLGTSMTAPLLITNNTLTVTNSGTDPADLAAGIYLKSTKIGSAGGTIYTKITDNVITVSSNAGEAYGVYEDAATKLYANILSNDMGGGVHGELTTRGVYLKTLYGFMGTTTLPLTVSGNTLVVTSDTMDASGVSLVSDNASTGTTCSTKIQYNSFDIDGATSGVYGVYASVMGKNLGLSMAAPILITNNSFDVANSGTGVDDLAAGIYLTSTKSGSTGGTIYTKIQDNALTVSSNAGETYGVYEDAATKLYTNIIGNDMDGGIHGELTTCGISLRTLTGSMGTAAIPVTITGNTLSVTSDTADAAGVFSISDKIKGGTIGNLANTGGSFTITAPENAYDVIDAEAVGDLAKLNAAITKGRSFIFVKAGTYTGTLNTVNRSVTLWGEGYSMFGMGTGSYPVLNNGLTLNADNIGIMGLDIRTGITVSGGVGATVLDNIFNLSGTSSNGVLVSGGTSTTISDNTFDGIGTGISVTGGSAIIGGNAFTLTGTGVRLSSGTTGDVWDNTFDVTGTGISVLGGTWTITGNTVYGLGTGVALVSGTTTVNGSNYFGVTGTGLNVSGGNGTIAGNTVACVGTGIARSGGAYSVNGTNVFDVLGTGVRVSGGTGSVSGNSFGGMGTGVTLLGGSATVDGGNSFTLMGTGVKFLAGGSGTVSGNVFDLMGTGIDISGGSAVIGGGNDFTITGTGIKLTGGTATVSDNAFSTTSDGIYVNGGTGSIDNNTFNVATNGVNYAGTNSVTTTGNTFVLTDTSEIGILISGGTGGTISGNDFTGTGTAVTFTGGSATVSGHNFTLDGTAVSLLGGTGTISGNTFTTTTESDCIYVNGGTGSIDGNIFNVPDSGNGIVYASGTGLNIGTTAGNIFDFNDAYGYTGVWITGGTMGTISGNMFSLGSSYGTGISITDGTMETISGNTFTGSGTGVSLSGGSCTVNNGNTFTMTSNGICVDVNGGEGSIDGNTFNVSNIGISYVSGSGLNIGTTTGNIFDSGSSYGTSVYVIGGTGATISDNTFTGSGVGVELYSGSATINGGNTFTLDGTGIVLTGGTGAISGNTFTTTSDGILVSGGTGSIDGNTFNVSSCGITYASGTGLNIGTTTGNIFVLGEVSDIGILVSGGISGAFSNNDFIGTGTGVTFTGGSALVGGGNAFTLDGTGIELLGGTATISENTFTLNHTGDVGVDGTGTISGNTFILNGASNIGIYTGGTITGNSFVLNGTSNIGIVNGTGTISGNLFTLNGTLSLGIDVMSGTVSGNTFTGTGNGVELSGGSATISGGNTFSLTGTGIRLLGGTGVILDNTFNTSLDGIYVNSWAGEIDGNIFNVTTNGINCVSSSGLTNIGNETGNIFNLTNSSAVGILTLANNLQFYGNSFSGSGVGISITGGNSIQIGHPMAGNMNTFTLSNDGIRISGGTGISINMNDFTITGADKSAVVFTGNVPASILNNTISSDYCGIRAEVTGNLTTGTISGNTIMVDGTSLGTDVYGIYLHATGNINTSISNNTISANGDDDTFGIYCNTTDTGAIGTSGTPASITGNTITAHSIGGAGYGIDLEAVSDIYSIIQNNDTSGGINVSGTDTSFGTFVFSTSGNTSTNISSNDNMSVVSSAAEAFGIYVYGYNVNGSISSNTNMSIGAGTNVFGIYTRTPVGTGTLGYYPSSTPLYVDNNSGTVSAPDLRFGVYLKTGLAGGGNYVTWTGTTFTPVGGLLDGNYPTANGIVAENFSGPPWVTDWIIP